jgi:hypothetical protein
MPSFPLPMVFLISRDPVSRKNFLCGAYLDFPTAGHFAHTVLQPILRLSVPRLFYASSRLWPEIGWVVRAAQTKRNKVVDFVVRVRSCG